MTLPLLSLFVAGVGYLIFSTMVTDFPDFPSIILSFFGGFMIGLSITSYILNEVKP